MQLALETVVTGAFGGEEDSYLEGVFELALMLAPGKRKRAVRHTTLLFPFPSRAPNML